jgi:hypothetical protein
MSAAGAPAAPLVRGDGVVDAEVMERVRAAVAAGGNVRVKCAVRPSTIPGAGDGLFAAEDIAEGTVVGQYVGDVYGAEDGMKLAPDKRAYFMRLGGDPMVFVDAGPHVQVLLRFVNDARDPERNNLRWEKRPQHADALAVTTRPVRAGDELFAPYGLWYWANFDPDLRARVVKALKRE